MQATLSLIAAQMLLYLRPALLAAVGLRGVRHPLGPVTLLAVLCSDPRRLHARWQVQDAILIPAAVVESAGIRRLLLSAFVHADDYPLYYNMVSLLWVGTKLEPMEGTRNFAKLVAVLIPASHGLFVAVSLFCWLVLGAGRMYVPAPAAACACDWWCWQLHLALELRTSGTTPLRSDSLRRCSHSRSS